MTSGTRSDQDFLGDDSLARHVLARREVHPAAASDELANYTLAPSHFSSSRLRKPG